MQYNYQCFQLFSNQLNWYEARMACQGLGGDLAALKTTDVNVSIYRDFDMCRGVFRSMCFGVDMWGC